MSLNICHGYKSNGLFKMKSMQFLGSSSCGASTCRNGGNCIETLSGYLCKCKDGYIGKNCEVGKYRLILAMDLPVTCDL